MIELLFEEEGKTIDDAEELIKQLLLSEEQERTEGPMKWTPNLDDE